MVAADAVAEYVDAIPLWIDIAAAVAAFVAAVWFTQGIRPWCGVAYKVLRLAAIETKCSDDHKAEQ